MVDTDKLIKELFARMILENSYWGYLFSIVRRRPVQLPIIMGVAPQQDGTIALMYNPDMVIGTSEQVLLKIVEHEGMHLLNNHISRLIRLISNETNPLRIKLLSVIWNIAADCSVNEQMGMPETLKINGEETRPHFPKNHDLPEKHATEFYYHRLLKNNEQQLKNAEKSLEDLIGQLKECHDNGSTGNHDQWGETGANDSHAFARKLENYVASTAREAAKSFNSNRRGTLPSYIQELIQDLLQPPKAPYYHIICKLVRGSRFNKIRRSPTRVNRKRTYVLNIDDENLPQISPFPGRARDFTFSLGVVIDTSGSMSNEDIAEGLSGIKHIIEKDRFCKTTVLEVDTLIGKEYVCRKVSDINFKVTGRGGTTLFPGLERCKQLGVDVALVFTDGYCENINEISRSLFPKKVIWVITKGGTPQNVNQTGFVVDISDK